MAENTDYRTLYDKDYIGAWDLNGKDATLTILRVHGVELRSEGPKKKTRRPVLWFKGAEKGMVVNVTNGKTIAGMYGPNVREWIGKRITIYPTTTSLAGQRVECIRIRPAIPAAGKQDAPPTGPPPMGSPPDRAEEGNAREQETPQ